jgi:signal transduction histidine kinase
VKIIDTFNISKAIKEVLEIQEDKIIMKEIDIEANYKINNVNIKTDKKRLQQVLLNILSNAVKFTNRKGKIIITTSLEDRDNKKYIVLEVEDTGCGIN